MYNVLAAIAILSAPILIIAFVIPPVLWLFDFVFLLASELVEKIGLNRIWHKIVNWYHQYLDFFDV